MKCDGHCDKESECQVSVKKVFVSGNGFITPWQFNYCETAISIDRENGFIVEVAGNNILTKQGNETHTNAPD